MANSVTGIGGASSPQSEPLEIAGTSKADAQAGSLTGTGSSSEPQASDATELSNVAAVIAASRRAATAPTIRTSLVSSLRAQIAAGTYRPNLDDVAARVAVAIKS